MALPVHAASDIGSVSTASGWAMPVPVHCSRSSFFKLPFKLDVRVATLAQPGAIRKCQCPIHCQCSPTQAGTHTHTNAEQWQMTRSELY